LNGGRAIAQAVSRPPSTAAARVRARVWSSGICGGQSGVEAGFLQVLRFPLPIFIPPNSPPSSQSPGAGTIGHSVADVPSGPSMYSTPHYANKKQHWNGRSHKVECSPFVCYRLPNILIYDLTMRLVYTMDEEKQGICTKFFVMVLLEDLLFRTTKRWEASIESKIKYDRLC
jgi:hypothetical protein